MSDHGGEAASPQIRLGEGQGQDDSEEAEIEALRTSTNEEDRVDNLVDSPKIPVSPEDAEGSPPSSKVSETEPADDSSSSFLRSATCKFQHFFKLLFSYFLSLHPGGRCSSNFTCLILYLKRPTHLVPHFRFPCKKYSKSARPAVELFCFVIFCAGIVISIKSFHCSGIPRTDHTEVY